METATPPAPQWIQAVFDPGGLRALLWQVVTPPGPRAEGSGPGANGAARGLFGPWGKAVKGSENTQGKAVKGSDTARQHRSVSMSHLGKTALAVAVDDGVVG